MDRGMDMIKKILSAFLVLVIALTGCSAIEDTTESTVEITTDAHFRNDYLLNEHYEKHGQYMGYDSAEEYEEGARAVISNPDCLAKTESEDGDMVYYLEDTNEIVFVSKDDIIRTYFNPDDGIDYFNRQ